jgi:hypothetical protein
MATQPQPKAGGAGAPHTGLVFQGPDGKYYKVPMAEIEKYEVPPDDLGGGEILPAGCAVACWF